MGSLGLSLSLGGGVPVEVWKTAPGLGGVKSRAANQDKRILILILMASLNHKMSME